MNGNRNIAGKAITAVLAAAVIAAVIPGMKTIIAFAGYRYADASRYSVGDTVITEPVRNLDIDWIEGSVNIAYHKGDTVELSEESQKKIGPDKQMRWRLDGDTLRIRYEKQNNSLFSFGPDLEKKLTLTLPEGTVLEEAKIDCTSASINIPSMQAEKVTLDTTSGDISAALNAQTISGESTSGSIRLEVTKDAGKISASTTSGNVDLEAACAEQIRIDATSGNINADIEEAKSVKADSTSGNIRVKISGLETIELETTSGDVETILPTEPGFTAHFSTTTGKVSYELPLEKKGDTYICGDGTADVKIETTTGNITAAAVG